MKEEKIKVICEFFFQIEREKCETIESSFPFFLVYFFFLFYFLKIKINLLKTRSCRITNDPLKKFLIL